MFFIYDSNTAPELQPHVICPSYPKHNFEDFADMFHNAPSAVLFFKESLSDFWGDPNNVYNLAEALPYSPYYGGLLRRYGVEHLLDVLVSEVHECAQYISFKKLANDLERMARIYTGNRIVRLPLDTELKIGKQFYTIGRLDKLAARGDVGRIGQSGPCFDIYDYASGAGRFVNYWLRPFDESMKSAIKNFGCTYNGCYATEHTSDVLRPVFYHNSDQQFFVFAP